MTMPLTTRERVAIARLRAVFADWPETLWLVVARIHGVLSEGGDF